MTQLRLTALVTASVVLAGSAAMLGLSEKNPRTTSYRVPNDAIGQDVLLHVEAGSFNPSIDANYLSRDRLLRGKLIYMSDEWITIQLSSTFEKQENNFSPTEFLSVRADQVKAIQTSF